MAAESLLSRHARCSRADLCLAIVLVGITVWLSFRPLWHTDLWGHLAYGRLYSESGAFPTTEPFLELSTKTPFVTTSWLSQWGGYQLHKWGGNRGLQLVYALLIGGILAAIYTTIRNKTYNPIPAALGTVAFAILEQQQLLVIRPQLAGLCCFCLFLMLISARRVSLWKLALVMLLWVNLHGSFLMGPVVLGMLLTTRAAKIAVKQSWSAARQDRVCRSWFQALLVILAMTFFNPYGIQLIREALTFSQSPNLIGLIEWKPIWKTPRQGLCLLIVSTIGLGLALSARVRMRWEWWVPTCVVGIKMLFTSRYIVWFSPLFVIALAPAMGYWTQRVLRKLPATAWFPQPVRFPRSVLMLVCGAGLVATSLGQALLTGDKLSPPESYGRKTPLAAGEALIELHKRYQVDGRTQLIFNTMEWGDWLIWRSRDGLPLLLNSHVTFIQPELWQDYLTLIRHAENWREAWERYPFTIAIVDYRKHHKLAGEIAQLPEWRETYRDQIAVIFVKSPGE